WGAAARTSPIRSARAGTANGERPPPGRWPPLARLPPRARLQLVVLELPRLAEMPLERRQQILGVVDDVGVVVHVGLRPKLRDAHLVRLDHLLDPFPIEPLAVEL